MPAHGASVVVRPDLRRLLVLAMPAVLVALTEGLTGQGRLLPRPVWLVTGAAAVVFVFVLHWLVVVSVADGCVAVRRGLTTRRLPLAELDRVDVEAWLCDPLSPGRRTGAQGPADRLNAAG